MPHTIPLVKLGGVEIRNLPVVISEDDGRHEEMLLGRDFLRTVHVWVSNSHHKVIFQAPPRPSPQIAAAP